jgi:hypothetical protein
VGGGSVWMHLSVVSYTRAYRSKKPSLQLTRSIAGCTLQKGAIGDSPGCMTATQ